VLHTRTSIEYRDGSAAIAPIIVGVGGPVGEFSTAPQRLAVERAIDDVLADSFPASDPPSWNPGVARPDPVVGAVGHEVAIVAASTAGAGRADRGVDVSILMSAERPFLQGLVSLAGAAGIALLVPFAILLVGLPVVLAVRGVLEVIGWLFGVAVQ
jgi:hypothetical protein